MNWGRGRRVEGDRRQVRGVLAHGVEGFVELLRDVAAFDLSRLTSGPLKR
ncbi:hypothetical protein DFR50_11459 [Roseiarcus fermentans]|uniref:Uncharacterized protein n=1 Tax=Roseiarcus fermentans TaxID=1473586 RepID=A0A366FE58_9HYPH|nr:hypothetical protein [Roseiarcus fermentans]RBP12230.1 hypothetical protein DFR50_11459 [Roseiarcus fermentans]